MGFGKVVLGGILIVGLGVPQISAEPEPKKERSEIICVKKRGQDRESNSNTSQNPSQGQHNRPKS
jgi:hypothetical protein